MKKVVLCAAALAAATVLVRPSTALADRPMMDPNRPVQCLRDTDGEVWRVQCNSITRVCLYAPNSELSHTGSRTKPLERARRCFSFTANTFDRKKLKAEGYRLVPGTPDAPHGWKRDQRGRVFQVNFDLKRRLYLGGSYTPMKLREVNVFGSRSSMDFGLFIFEHYEGHHSPTRHRIRLVEGEVYLEPFSAKLVLAHYDLSRRFLQPLLRFTTFFGTPQRHDLTLNLGMWTEAGNLEIHHNEVAESSLWKFGTAQVTLDLWQSPRLDSYLRVRTGLGVERLFINALDNRTAITAGWAAELDWVLDDAGFHNMRAEVTYERPYYFDPGPVQGKRAKRMRALLQYEAIILAINDQPLSLRVGAGGEKRNDIPMINNYDWAFVANAGLRFSLWAPPRRAN